VQPLLIHANKPCTTRTCVSVNPPYQLSAVCSQLNCIMDPNAIIKNSKDIGDTRSQHVGFHGGSPTAVQGWRPCPLWEPSSSHPMVLL